MNTNLIQRIIEAISTTDFRDSTGDIRWIGKRYQQLKHEPSRDRPGLHCDFGEALQRAREEWLNNVLAPVLAKRTARTRK